MKAIQTAALVATTLVILAMTTHPAIGQVDANPPVPIGSLTAFPTIVQTGTHPTLTWDITHPETIDDVVDIEGPGTIVPKKCLTMDVRVIGASVKRVWLNYWGQVTRWEWVPTEARMSFNNGSYNRIWFDTQDDVEPDQIVHSQVVRQGDRIDFGARYTTSSGGWATFRSSTNSNHNVIALRNGDTPPTTTPLYQQPTIESFILPYLDDNGNISIGPKDVLYLMELTHTDRYHGGFDLQDMCILVTFIEESVDSTACGGDGGSTGGTTGSTGGTTGDSGNGNNGHGNNIDGVDSSNPGNSPHVDSDPTVDDEGRRGRGRGRRRR